MLTDLLGRRCAVVVSACACDLEPVYPPRDHVSGILRVVLPRPRAHRFLLLADPAASARALSHWLARGGSAAEDPPPPAPLHGRPDLGQRVARRFHLRLANALERAVSGAVASIPGIEQVVAEPLRDIPLPPAPIARMILISLDMGHGPNDVLALVGSRAGLAALAQGVPDRLPDDPRRRAPLARVSLPAEIRLKLPALTPDALAALRPGDRLVSLPGAGDRAVLAVRDTVLATGSLLQDRGMAGLRVSALGA